MFYEHWHRAGMEKLSSLFDVLWVPEVFLARFPVSVTIIIVNAIIHQTLSLARAWYKRVT